MIETPQGANAISLGEFSDLVHLIHEGALDSTAWQRFLKTLTLRLRGNSSVLILRIPKLGEVPLRVSFGDIPKMAAAYFQHYMAADPFVQLPEGRAVTMHDFVNPTELEQTEYFRDYLEPLDTVYALGIDLRDKGRYHVRLRICRPRHEGNFSAADCQFAEMFVPHLKTAIRMYAELDVVRAERTFYAEAMNQLTLATIVVDEGARVLHANQLADSILAENDGIARAHDALSLANREDANRFRELISHAVEAQRLGKPGLVEVMRVRRPSGRPDIGVVIRPSSSQFGKRGENLNTSIAVFLSTDSLEATPQNVPSEVIQKLFGLTPKEATLALRLTAGESLQEAAEQLEISPNTARAHLRSIFSKTGVDRQARLVRVLLKSVAMLGH